MEKERIVFLYNNHSSLEENVKEFGLATRIYRCQKFYYYKKPDEHKDVYILSFIDSYKYLHFFRMEQETPEQSLKELLKPTLTELENKDIEIKHGTLIQKDDGTIEEYLI